MLLYIYNKNLPLREIRISLITYMATRSNLAPLDAIRVALKTTVMNLEPLTHQVNALPQEFDLEYYFVPIGRMGLFAPYYRPGEPFKNLKLINYDRPAIALTFFPKHKYTIDREVTPQNAQEVLQEYRDTLFNNSFLNPLTAIQEKELLHIDTLLRSMRQNPDQFRFATSNYHHYYRYWYCSFRYFEDSEQTKTGTHNEHMLKYTESVDRRTKQSMKNERLNIIFVDTNYITKPVPYDNKLIDQELSTYSDRIKFGKATLYVKSAE
jgi:hypothetical protein